MKTWLYARVSTAKNLCRGCGKTFLSAEEHPVCATCGSADIQKSQDTENQLRVMRTWIRELGHEVDHEYVDRASGGSGDREKFKQMLRDVAAYKKNHPILIGFWALDRLSREGVIETLQYLQLFDKAGFLWKSYTEQYLDSTGIFKEAIIAIFAALAKQQRIRMKENTIAGLERARVMGTKSGKPIGRPPKFNRAIAIDLYAQMKSYRAVARALGVSYNTVRFAIQGRPEDRPKMVEWSAPVWGNVENGLFVECKDGSTVVRFDKSTGLPHCMNHKQLLSGCLHVHKEERI